MLTYKMLIFIPVLEISRIYCFWGDSPGTTISASRKPFEIKLAAYFRIRSTSVGDVVTVEGHHMAKNICDRSHIYNKEQQTCVNLQISSPNFQNASALHIYSASSILKQQLLY